MDSLIFSLNAVMPIVGMVAIGYLLKRMGMMDEGFAKKANKLVFHLFLPVMLFLNIYKIESLQGLDFGYVAYILVALLVIFLAALFCAFAVTKRPERRGAFVQACFRSNYALIGIPLAQSLYGEEGVIVATLLTAFTIPALNILAVVCLSVFRADGKKPHVGRILLGIVKNPLIQSVALGFLVLLIRAIFDHTGIDFRLTDVTPLHKVLTYLSNLATPLALISLGAQFEFSVVSGMRREILLGSLIRTVVVPIVGIGGAYILFKDTFSGAHFATFVAIFATPVSVSSVPMAQEMGGDSTLAGQLVVWTTLISGLTIFITAFLLREAGIF